MKNPSRHLTSSKLLNNPKCSNSHDAALHRYCIYYAAETCLAQIILFWGHAALQFSFDSQSCCGTVLFAPNPRPLKKRAAGFPLQSLARG
ncbi:MAG: hypothetical protein WAT27_09860, partial [Chitinophagales bacterium]